MSSTTDEPIQFASTIENAIRQNTFQ